MIAESVNKSVPKRLVFSDESGFNSTYEIAFCSFKDHKPGVKILASESFTQLQVFPMFSNAVIEFIGFIISRCAGTPHTPTCRYSLSYVNWYIISGTIDFMKAAVYSFPSCSVNRINTGTVKSFRRWYGENRRSVEKADSVLDYLLKLRGVEDVMIAIKL